MSAARDRSGRGRVTGHPVGVRRPTGAERRHQLIDIARTLFAQRGYEGTSIEEIAQRANVSKPVVYEHFGGKEGLYAVVVDREGTARLVLGRHAPAFGFDGWHSPRRLHGTVAVLTPPTSVRALRNGFVPTLHESARLAA